MASPPRIDLSLSGFAGSKDACLADVGARADVFFGEGRHRIETISVLERVQRGLDGSIVGVIYEYDAWITDGVVRNATLAPGETFTTLHTCDFQPTLWTVECTICGTPA